MNKFDKLLRKAEQNLQKNKNYNKAVHYYIPLLELRPNSAKLWCALAFVHNLRGDFRKAIDAGNQALHIEPVFEEALNTLFFSYDKVGEYGNALRILHIYRKSYQVTLDKTFEILEDLVPLISDVRDIMIPFPSPDYILYDRRDGVNGNININEMERQILLREIIREHGLRYIIPLNFQYGFIFSRIFTSTKKIEALKLVLEEFPLNSFVWNMLAVGYREQNEHEKSVQALEKALEINPASAETWDNVGLTHLKMKQFEEAEHAFKRAIDIDRKVSERWINLGITYLKLNQIDNAIDALRRSLNCKSYKLRKLEQHGESKAVPHLSIKELKDNIPTFNLIFNVDLPKFSWYYLAKAYYKKQEYEKALEACRESLAIDYKFDKVYTLRKKILSAKSSEIRKRNNF